jgi:hypothetical protein
MTAFELLGWLFSSSRGGVRSMRVSMLDGGSKLGVWSFLGFGAFGVGAVGGSEGGEDGEDEDEFPVSFFEEAES